MDIIADKEKLIELSKNHFKPKEYKKKGNSWFKYSADLISCFNIQTSQWDNKDYYVNVGIVIIGIDDNPETAPGKWHFQQRIDDTTGKSIEAMLSEVDLWLEKHSDIDYLSKIIKMDYHERLPVIVMQKAVDFLSRRSEKQ